MTYCRVHLLLGQVERMVKIKPGVRVLAALAASALVATACGTAEDNGGGLAEDLAGGEDTTATDDGEDGESAGADGDYRIGFIPQIEGIPYYDGFRQGADAAAAEFGVTYEQTGPATVSSPDQLRIFESLVSQGFDAIALSPLDPTSINSSINSAVAAGTPVLTSDADAPGSDRQVFVAQALDQDLGYALMDDLARQIGESGQIGIVSGIPDTASLDAWVDAMLERMEAEYPDMELVGGVRNTEDSEDALREAQDLMTAYPEIEGIVAVPSTAVPGVAQAVQNADKAGEIAVIGYGSPNTAGPFIDAGVMETTVLWNVEELGWLTVWAAIELIEGRELQPVNEVPGIDRPIEFDEETGVLLLGPPVLFDASNHADFDF
jgi:rhamnose transport system substrate-binding protein